MVEFLAGALMAAAGLPFWVFGAGVMGRSMRGETISPSDKLRVFAWLTLKVVALGIGWRYVQNADSVRVTPFALGLMSVYFAFVAALTYASRDREPR